MIDFNLDDLVTLIGLKEIELARLRAEIDALRKKLGEQHTAANAERPAD